MNSEKKIDIPVEIVHYCRICRKKVPLIVDLGDHMRYMAGIDKVQDAFPYLKPAERELFLSGLCGQCWDDAFGGYEV